MKLASGVTFSASTPRCSTTIFFTRSATSLMFYRPCMVVPVGSIMQSVGHESSMNVPCARGFLTQIPLGTKGPSPRLENSRQSESNHRHATIHVQRLAGHITGLGTGEMDRGSGNIIGGAEPARGYARDDRLLLLFVQDLGHRRGDEPRSDGIDGDITAGKLLSQRLGHPDHSRLGSRVIGLPGISG